MKNGGRGKERPIQSSKICISGKSLWVRRTSADNLLYLDKGNINFLGKFSHCLIRVLIGERVDINLDPWERETNRVVGKDRKETLENCEQQKARRH